MSGRPRIVLLVATARGLRVLRAALAALPDADYTVVTFREGADEPPFCDAIAQAAAAASARFAVQRTLGPAGSGLPWTEPQDVMLAAGWRYLVPGSVYESMRRGAYVLHDSLLPAYRGFAPTVWALVNGEQQVGATLLTMAAGADEGDIIAQHSIPVGDDDRIAEVMERVTGCYERIIADWLPRLLAGPVPTRPQDAAQATYGCKRADIDNRIFWQWPTKRIYNLIRAVTRPYPGAWTTHRGARVTIWGASPVGKPRTWAGRSPGRVVEVRRGVGVVVLTGDGEILIREAQAEGGPADSADRIVASITDTLQ